MGRYDALTQLEAPVHHPPSPVVPPPPPKKTPVQHSEPHREDEHKPEIMKSRNHDKSPLMPSFKEKPLKYSTLLDGNLIKKIKLFAAERAMKDYEVVELAISEYFEKHK